MGTLRYEANNSGGHWWLNDGDWRALEEAGWTVKWVKAGDGLLSRDGRFLGALATVATIETNDPSAAVAAWERVTGQTATDVGCNCCGEPHIFTFTADDGSTRMASIVSGPASLAWS